MRDDPLTIPSIDRRARAMTATGKLSRRLPRDRFVASIQEEDSDER